MKKIIISSVMLAVICWATEVGATTYNAATCQFQDVAKALARAGNGDTVFVPAGAADWGAPGFQVTASITIAGDSNNPPVITMTDVATPFWLAPNPGGFITLKNFRFVDTPTGPSSQFLFITGSGVCFHVQNVSWTSSRPVACANIGYAGSILNANGPYGLFDHCNIIGTANTCEGFVVVDNNAGEALSWHTPMSMGTTRCVVFEDCTATKPDIGGQVFCDGMGGARICIRHCALTNFVEVVHGYPCGAGNGTLQLEFYNNLYVHTNTVNPCTRVVWLRGGTGVIYSNTVLAAAGAEINCAWHFSDECASAASASEGCLRQWDYPADYPSTNQVGQGVVGRQQGSVPVYVWGNKVQTRLGETVFGLDASDARFIANGRDVFINTVNPQYKPLVYPHPLAGAN